MTSAPVILNMTKLGFRRTEAAAFIGVSASKFDQMVKAGDMPEPHRIGGVVIWRGDDLLAAFNRLTGRGDDGEVSPQDAWDKAVGLG
jgi:predicted DNA-binding transcriptional regulator AlpA